MSNGSLGRGARPAVRELRGWLQSWWPVPFHRWWVGREVGLLYAAAVAVVSLVVAIQPPHRLRMLVEQSSTNLDNMSSHPFAVLLLSAFVVSPAIGLLLLIPVVIAYGEVQRWLGGLSTSLVAVFGHVGATLVVTTLEITALRDHLVGLRIVIRPDVGVNYALFAAIGALLYRVPRRWRAAYAIACLIVLAALLISNLNFTNLGHTSAWLIGVALSWLMHTAADSSRVGRASAAESC